MRRSAICKRRPRLGGSFAGLVEVEAQQTIAYTYTLKFICLDIRDTKDTELIDWIDSDFYEF